MCGCRVGGCFSHLLLAQCSDRHLAGSRRWVWTRLQVCFSSSLLLSNVHRFARMFSKDVTMQCTWKAYIHIFVCRLPLPIFSLPAGHPRIVSQGKRLNLRKKGTVATTPQWQEASSTPNGRRCKGRNVPPNLYQIKVCKQKRCKGRKTYIQNWYILRFFFW